MQRFVFVLSAAVAVGSACRPAEPIAPAMGVSVDIQKKDVDLKAPDGINLKGTYFSPDHAGPAVLLLHQCNMDRHAWDPLAADLAGEGFHVLTVDLRGFGESGGKATNVAEAEAMSAKRSADVDAMLAYLLQQSGVDTSRVAAGGASCGVTLSTDLAAHHPEIKTLIELSGLATDAARAYFAQTPGVAIFGAASEGDGGAAQSIRDLVEASKNPHSKLGIYPGTEHGVPMFSKHPELELAIVSWMKAQLIQNGATRSQADPVIAGQQILAIDWLAYSSMLMAQTLNVPQVPSTRFPPLRVFS